MKAIDPKVGVGAPIFYRENIDFCNFSQKYVQFDMFSYIFPKIG